MSCSSARLFANHDSAFFNDVTYVRPKVPTLMTALTTGNAAANPTVYGINTNSFVLNKGDVVEIILNNNDPGKHPFHLHGHHFQLAYRSDDEGEQSSLSDYYLYIPSVCTEPSH